MIGISLVITHRNIRIGKRSFFSHNYPASRLQMKTARVGGLIRSKLFPFQIREIGGLFSNSLTVSE